MQATTLAVQASLTRSGHIASPVDPDPAFHRPLKNNPENHTLSLWLKIGDT
jgi:hypothetical protein